MDTLSRDSNSSGSIVPLVGVIAGGLALVLAIVALFKLSDVKKTLALHEESMTKIATLENDMHAATAKSDGDLKALRANIQDTFNQVGTKIGAIDAQIAKLEEAAKRPAPAAAKGGAAAAPTGVRNADGTYSVAPGDTLSKIAKKFGTRVDAIEAENPGIDPTRLRVGQKIRLPGK